MKRLSEQGQEEGGMFANPGNHMMAGMAKGAVEQAGADPRFSSVMKTAGAGAAVGVVAGATILGAPVLLGLAGAAGGTYLATRSGETGAAARRAGVRGSDAAKVGFGHAKTFNDEHDVTGKTTRAAKSAYQGAIDFDQKHDVTGKTSRAASATHKAATDFNDRHDVTGKAAKAGKAVVDGTKAGYARAQEYDQKHDVSGKTAAAARNAAARVSAGYSAASAYNKEHDISGRAGRAASDAASTAAGAASKAWGSIWGKK